MTLDEQNGVTALVQLAIAAVMHKTGMKECTISRPQMEAIMKVYDLDTTYSLAEGWTVRLHEKPFDQSAGGPSDGNQRL